jgi:hypothetical protein
VSLPLRVTPAAFRRSFFVLTLATGIALSGCAKLGVLAYFMGAGRGKKIQAEYILPEGKLLILVDDPRELVTWPQARELLVQFTGEALLSHEAIDAVISPESIAKFRQMDPEFDKYPATVIGEKVGAETVMWLQVRDFFAPTEIEDTSTAAKLAVTIKILNVGEERRADRVRLWPDDRDGYLVETELSAIGVDKLQGDNAVAKELARKTAVQIGRLFYQHTLGEIEDEDRE